MICQGTALLASDFQYRHELATDSTKARQSRSKESGSVLQILLRLACQLRGDAPVYLNINAEADELDLEPDELQVKIQWLIDRRYLALDGHVDGLARLWINPSVAFLPRLTDPRVAAARHKFPYIVTDDEGMAAEQPVHVAEYNAEGWEHIYRINAEQLEDPPRFSYGCPLHHQTGPHSED
ncbi:hypothetical protein [Streptomyces olivaceus]|uniref:hypothetical protein n=1 Tax=Streptomyces olivaceus TaxID=47716 RepID=UPI001CCD2A0F|nr:hypothetical protein [Streptomyces olivaceus]MBZ6284691.1 hypothetical protein [Streptomyces olivaceus]